MCWTGRKQLAFPTPAVSVSRLESHFVDQHELVTRVPLRMDCLCGVVGFLPVMVALGKAGVNESLRFPIKLYRLREPEGRPCFL